MGGMPADTDQHDLHIIVPAQLRAEAITAAAAQDLKLGQWLRRAIREKLDREDRSRIPGPGQVPAAADPWRKHWACSPSPKLRYVEGLSDAPAQADL
jgi:hypothetical protein